MKKKYYILANTGAGMPCFSYNNEVYDNFEEAEEVAKEIKQQNKDIHETWVDNYPEEI